MIAVLLAIGLSATPLDSGPTVRIQTPAPIEIAVKDGKIDGPRTIRVHQGDAVSLRIASDRPMALHLHGYDLERTAGPEAPAMFEFTARATGRFSIEEHLPESATKRGAHAPALLYLEVLPK